MQAAVLNSFLAILLPRRCWPMWVAWSLRPVLPRPHLWIRRLNNDFLTIPSELKSVANVLRCGLDSIPIPPYGIPMKQKSKQAVQTRLAKIAGQINAVSRMVDDDRYCIDVIRQVRAAKAALSSLEQVMLREHVDTCVTHALTGDDVALRKERVEELVAVLAGTKK